MIQWGICAREYYETYIKLFALKTKYEAAPFPSRHVHPYVFNSRLAHISWNSRPSPDKTIYHHFYCLCLFGDVVLLTFTIWRDAIWRKIDSARYGMRLNRRDMARYDINTFLDVSNDFKKFFFKLKKKKINKIKKKIDHSLLSFYTLHYNWLLLF